METDIIDSLSEEFGFSREIMEQVIGRYNCLNMKRAMDLTHCLVNASGKMPELPIVPHESSVLPWRNENRFVVKPMDPNKTWLDYYWESPRPWKNSLGCDGGAILD